MYSLEDNKKIRYSSIFIKRLIIHTSRYLPYYKK